MKDFRRWEKGEKSSCVLIVERRNLKGLFPVAALRGDRSHLLPVVLQVGRRDLLEANGSPVVSPVLQRFIHKQAGPIPKGIEPALIKQNQILICSFLSEVFPWVFPLRFLSLLSSPSFPFSLWVSLFLSLSPLPSSLSSLLFPSS